MLGRRVAPVAVLACTGLLASGCAASSSSSSAGDFSGQAKGVATTLDDLRKDGRASNEDAICTKLLAAALVQQIKTASSTSCQTAVNDVLKDVDAFEVKPDGKDAITVRGATASARVTTGTGSRKRHATVALVQQGGRWKISDLGS